MQCSDPRTRVQTVFGTTARWLALSLHRTLLIWYWLSAFVGRAGAPSLAREACPITYISRHFVVASSQPIGCTQATRRLDLPHAAVRDMTGRAPAKQRHNSRRRRGDPGNIGR